MTHRCWKCQENKSKQLELRDRRMLLWRRGELSDTLAEELERKERWFIEELEKHEATYHQPSVYA